MEAKIRGVADTMGGVDASQFGQEGLDAYNREAERGYEIRFSCGVVQVDRKIRRRWTRCCARGMC